MENKRDIKIKELGTTYMLPKWQVQDNVGIVQTPEVQEITFVRGDKTPPVTDEEFDAAVERLNNIAAVHAVHRFNKESMEFEYSTETESLGDASSIPEWKNRTDYTKAKKTIERRVNYVKRVPGILHEQLLEMSITDLTYKNQLVKDDHTVKALEHLKLALFWLEERARDRERRGVLGTYNQ